MNISKKRGVFLTTGLSALTLALAVAGGVGVGSSNVSAHNSNGWHGGWTDDGTISNRLEEKLVNRFSDDKTDCTLTAEQVAELDAFFKVRTFDLDVNGQSMSVAAVKGKHLTKAQLRDYLEASSGDLDCSIVRHHDVFYLQVMPAESEPTT